MRKLHRGAEEYGVNGWFGPLATIDSKGGKRTFAAASTKVCCADKAVIGLELFSDLSN